jgi:hypothetical protein
VDVSFSRYRTASRLDVAGFPEYVNAMAYLPAMKTEMSSVVPVTVRFGRS